MEFRVETARLVLDRLREGDEDRVFLWATDPIARRYMAFQRHETMESVRAFVRSASAPAPRPAALLDFVIAIRQKSGGLLIGTTGIHQQSASSVDTGYILDPACWRQGYGSEAVAGLIDWIFANMSSVEMVSARVFRDNVASQGLARKIGMRPLREEVVDTPRGDKNVHQIVFSILRTEWEARA